MNAFILLILAACLLLPTCYVAAALPALWLIQAVVLGNPYVFVAVGPVEFTLVDVVLIFLFTKTGLSIILKREFIADRPLYLAAAVFLGVQFLASLASVAHFGNLQMTRSITSLARFIAELAIAPVLAQSIKTTPQARRCAQIVLGTLLILGVIQFINFFGASRGIIIGEVQGIERGEQRYFGPVGDSVGFVLLLGYIFYLCAWKPGGVFLFGGGIVLTAGIGAMFGTGVATILFLIFGIQGDAVKTFTRKYLWMLPMLLFCVAVASATVGQTMAKTLIDRFTHGKVGRSAELRMVSTKFAARVILDNPVFGVGFMGFANALPSYGARQYFDLSKPDGGRANANNQFLQSLCDAGMIGLFATGVLITAMASSFRRAETRSDDPLLRTMFRASFIWLLALVFGNQAAVWLIPSSYVARLLWVLLGIAIAVQRLSDGIAGGALSSSSSSSYSSSENDDGFRGRARFPATPQLLLHA